MGTCDGVVRVQSATEGVVPMGKFWQGSVHDMQVGGRMVCCAGGKVCVCVCVCCRGVPGPAATTGVPQADR